MSKHVREKCGKLCISSILSSKRGITPTKLDANWRHSNLICSTVKQSYVQNFSSICQSMLEKSVENWRTETRTDGRMDGRRVGRTETRTDRHRHTIIRPVWRRAYNKNDQQWLFTSVLLRSMNQVLHCSIIPRNPKSIQNKEHNWHCTFEKSG